MKQETIKNLHKVGNEEVRNLLETEFPETFKPDFDIEEYLKELIESANQIDINEHQVELRKDGNWILEFRKDHKEYWMGYYHFRKIKQETKLSTLETRELCTTTLNTLTGWEGVTTGGGGFAKSLRLNTLTGWEGSQTIGGS